MCVTVEEAYNMMSLQDFFFFRSLRSMAMSHLNERVKKLFQTPVNGPARQDMRYNY